MSNEAYPNSADLTAEEAHLIIEYWQQHFPGVRVITSPSLGHEHLTFSHGFSGVNHMNVYGLEMKSPLFTNALASFEVAEDENGISHYASAYEIMWPNINMEDIQSSTMNEYVKDLWKVGLDVHSDHYHWKSDMLHPAVHHMGIDIHPLEFSAKTVAAIQRLVSNTSTDTSVDVEDVMTTANGRGTISIPRSDGIANANGNGNGAGINVGALRRNQRTTLHS